MADGLAYFGTGDVNAPVVGPSKPKTVAGYLHAIDLVTIGCPHASLAEIEIGLGTRSWTVTPSTVSPQSSF